MSQQLLELEHADSQTAIWDEVFLETKGPTPENTTLGQFGKNSEELAGR